MKQSSRIRSYLFIATAVLVFVTTVRCGRDAHLVVTEQKVPNPIAHPIQERQSGNGDGFGPVDADPATVRGTRPAMPAINPPPPAPIPVPVPPLMVPPIPNGPLGGAGK